VWSYLRLVYYLLRPRTIFVRCSTHGLGDNLLLSAVLPYLRETHPSHKIVVETRWPDLFYNNPHADWVTDRHMKTTGRHIKPKYHVDRNTEDSIYRQIMRRVGADRECFPELFLAEDEIAEIDRLFPSEYVTICPRGKTTFCANRKEWGFENFQGLRDLMPEVRFLQVGIPSDPLLENVVDGRHLNARQTAAAIRKSRFFIGLEGGLMHLAKAVGLKAVIIYGGLIKPEISGYEENLNIYQAVECSPCFHSDRRHEDCETMKCMKAISPAMVYDRIRRELIESDKRGG
jgi:ADP-heptose:LPS heptosyltransferase